MWIRRIRIQIQISCVRTTLSGSNPDTDLDQRCSVNRAYVWSTSPLQLAWPNVCISLLWIVSVTYCKHRTHNTLLPGTMELWCTMCRACTNHDKSEVAVIHHGMELWCNYLCLYTESLYKLSTAEWRYYTVVELCAFTQRACTNYPQKGGGNTSHNVYVSSYRKLVQIVYSEGGVGWGD